MLCCERYGVLLAVFVGMLCCVSYRLHVCVQGGMFNDIMKEAFNDTQIEDLWVRYFCISTNVSKARLQLHQSGPLWKYVRASMTVCVCLGGVTSGAACPARAPRHCAPTRCLCLGV